MTFRASQRKDIANIQNRRSSKSIRFNTYTYTDESSTPLFVYQSGGKYKNIPGWVSGPAVYDHYILHYIVSGKGIYYCRGKKYDLSAGDIFLIEPYQEITYIADMEDPYLYYWVGFNGTECAALLHQIGYSSDRLVIDHGIDDTITSYFKKIVDIHYLLPGQNYSLTGWLYLILALLINKSTHNEITNSSRYYTEAVSYIRMHQHESSLTVQSIADAICIDRTYLYRIFMEEAGKSIQDFIASSRTREASLFLVNTTESLAAIAENCGFPNASRFSQVFKRVTGITPREFRENSIKQNNGSLASSPSETD